MLRNFVTDSYLEKFYPNILNDRQGRETGYTEKIATAFGLVLNDLTNRGIDPRLCMVPLDLNRTKTQTNLQQLTSSTLSATTNGVAWLGTNQRRFGVYLTSKTVAGDTWAFILQGSNKSDEPTDSDTTWETVSTITNTATDTVGEVTQTFDSMYKWYRIRATKSGSGSVTFTACLYETQFDSLIAWKSLSLIATSWVTGNNPRWELMKEDADTQYSDTLKNMKFTYDQDEDGIPTASEPKTSSVRLYR